jgi:hypothetical protein
MKNVAFCLALLLLIGSASAETDPSIIQRAANGVTRLRSKMKDPESFVLEAAYLKKPDKHGVSEICFYYRAHNSYGGYGGIGETVLLKNDSLFMVDAGDQANPFFGLMDPCRPSTRIADITADLLRALNPSPFDLIKSAADRPKLVEAENARFKKEGVAGYAEMMGDTYTVHSERATSIRFHANMLQDEAYMKALKRAEIVTLVYTNDTDLKFVYDMKSGQIVPADRLGAAPTQTPKGGSD